MSDFVIQQWRISSGFWAEKCLSIMWQGTCKKNSTRSKYCANEEQFLVMVIGHLQGPAEVVHGLETSRSWLTSTPLVKSKERICKLHLCKMVWQPLVVVAVRKLQFPGEIQTSALGELVQVTENGRGVDPEVCFKCRESRIFNCVLWKSCSSLFISAGTCQGDSLIACAGSFIYTHGEVFWL